MRFSNIIKNDFCNGEGICVSLFTQGCPHRCHGCFNPETWAEDGGQIKDRKALIEDIKIAITANGLARNFSILGGEPLAPYNLEDVYYIIKEIRQTFPTITIFLWSGYTIEELIDRIIDEQNDYLLEILQYADILIEGRFMEELKDLTLKLRGSSNQSIIDLKSFDLIKKIWYNKIKKEIKDESKNSIPES